MTEEQLDWLESVIPDTPRHPKGGRPPADKRKVIKGIFWILDNGAKWKDLPKRFGSMRVIVICAGSLGVRRGEFGHACVRPSHFAGRPA